MEGDLEMKITFSFGRNWKNYVKNVVDEKVIQEAKESLLKYLPEGEFKDKVFIDVGCGSGLFSLSAVLLGCKHVISFDIDPASIEATLLLKEKFSHILPSNYSWDIFQGNILDSNLVESLKEKGDIVYSWGVLHHTGKMWDAIKNTASLVKDGGYLILAIYNHAPSSEFWLEIKKFYNKHPLLQPLLIALYGSYITFGFMIRRKTLKLRRERGMHVFYDAIDWLGGLPYEFACFDEVKEYVENLGFNLINAPTKIPCGEGVRSNIFDKIRHRNTGCNEFVFQKKKFD
jgi:2-polyprenyl-3-methyl-5-hydroxy-6-metoxy-1,4-benzoquinol methylase